MGEPLNETMCGCRGCDCPGLVARGTLRLHLHSGRLVGAPSSHADAAAAAGHNGGAAAANAVDAAVAMRAAAELANDPPLLLTARGRDVLAWASRQLLRHQRAAHDGTISEAEAMGKSGERGNGGRQARLETSALVVAKLLELGGRGAALARPFTGAKLFSSCYAFLKLHSQPSSL